MAIFKENFLIFLFEWFTDKRIRLGDIFISISPQNIFRFSVGFVEKAKLKNKIYVKLGYSSMQKAIIFDFHKEKMEGDYKIHSKMNRSTNRTIQTACHSFFKMKNLNAEDLAGRYEVHLETINEKEYWVIYL